MAALVLAANLLVGCASFQDYQTVFRAPDDAPPAPAVPAAFPAIQPVKDEPNSALLDPEEEGRLARELLAVRDSRAPAQVRPVKPKQRPSAVTGRSAGAALRP